MTILYINTGTSPNSGDGDSLRSAFNKINANFQYLSTASFTGNTGTSTGGTANLGDIVITGATFGTVNANENISFDPNGTGVVRFQNTPIQFDNGAGSNMGSGAQILKTKPTGSPVGLGLDNANSSLRIVGDRDTLGTLVDLGLYNGAGNSWSSKVYIDYHGNVASQGYLTAHGITSYGGVTATGLITALNGIRFSDDSTITTGVAPLSVSYYTSGTTTGTITNINALKFDTNSGFDLIDLGGGAAFVGLNSTFKYWEIAGQETLIANGLDHIEFIAGPGVSITTNPHTSTQQISFSASTIYGGSLGYFTIAGNVLYPTTGTNGVVISNTSSQSNSFISIPPFNDPVIPFFISSPNEVRLTTEAGSVNPITIAPNQDGTGPGYVVISSDNSTSTAGVFLNSYSAQINLWPNPTIGPIDYVNPDVGALDLLTIYNEHISIRPGGTGTVIVTAPLQARQGILLGTEDSGAGGSATQYNYHGAATELTVTTPVHKLSAGDYWLAPGTEGQLAYFVPTTGAVGSGVRVWFENVRVMTSGTAVVQANQIWLPFHEAATAANGVVMAIYTDGAWTTSHGYTS